MGAARPPADCLIATKLSIPPGGWAALEDGALRDHVRASAERSAQELDRRPIDVLQVHNATAEDAHRDALIEALEALREEGVVRLTGATVYSEPAALACAGAFDLVQVAMNVLDRRPEARVLPLARDRGTAVVARSALLHGVLTPAGRDLAGPFAPLREAADAFRMAAGVSWEQLPAAAVAWLASRPDVHCVLLGPRDARELDALLEAPRHGVPDGGWGSGLSAELLDPRRWPALEAVG